MEAICLEVVKWKSKNKVVDEMMIKAASNIVIDLKNCEGFIQQVLCKNSLGEWVAVYYWKNEECAHASNEYMADKEAFINLMALVDVDSVSIETMMSVQASGGIDFDSI